MSIGSHAIAYQALSKQKIKRGPGDEARAAASDHDNDDIQFHSSFFVVYLWLASWQKWACNFAGSDVSTAVRSSCNVGLSQTVE